MSWTTGTQTELLAANTAVGALRTRSLAHSTLARRPEPGIFRLTSSSRTLVSASRSWLRLTGLSALPLHLTSRWLCR